jgi:hypothetical protein
VNSAANAAFTYIADIPLTTEIWIKWESALLFASINGQCSGIRALELIYDHRLLGRVLSICGISWSASETHPAFQNSRRYSVGKGGYQAFYNAPKTLQYVARSVVAARLPHLVEEAEVYDFLATAEAQFADLSFQMLTAELPLSLVCSLCAWHLGDRKQALVYAKAELLRNLNPLKKTLAQMALAAC